jgi:hypothetical protein
MLDTLQDSVRAAGRAHPNQETLISALILYERRRGESLEDELLRPFRLSHPGAE